MKKISILFLILLLLILGGFLILGKQKTNIKTSQPGENKKNNMITETSPAFQQNGTIPKKYTCGGENINPPLAISSVPNNARSLVLIVDDPDAPSGVWTHWLVWNINVQTKEIKENSLPEGAILGTNDFGQTNYGGPCPPSGTHRYFFKIYALDVMLNLSQGAKRPQLEQAMINHIIDQGELVGKYSK